MVTTTPARFLLTALSVTASLLALPGGTSPILSLVGLVPLGLALHGASPTLALALGYTYGFGGWAGSTGGLTVALASYVGLPAGQALLFVVGLAAYLAIPYGAFGLLCGLASRTRRRTGTWWTAACLTVLVSLFPTPIPAGPAHGLYVHPLAIQLLDLGGEPLLLFAVGLFNWLVVDLLLRLRHGEAIGGAIVSLAAVLAVVGGYGIFRLDEQRRAELAADGRGLVTVAAIQPNLPLPGATGGVSSSSDDPVPLLRQMSAEAVARSAGLELVVWPETPSRFGCEPALEELDKAGAGPPLLINCVEQAPQGRDYNTALLVSRDAAPLRYHKQKLFPFAEYLPGEVNFPLLRKVLRGAARYAPGAERALFPVAGHRTAFPAICYEVLFSDQVRKLAGMGGDILVNQTNDAWFGESRIPDFLLAAAVFRAVEQRVPVVRASNSGDSLMVKATGEVLRGSRTPRFTRAITASALFVPERRSPFSHLGNAFLYGLALAWLVSLKRARSRTSP